MVTNIYLLRHGEVDNPKKIIYGRLPGYELSQNGIKEVEQTANFLKDKNISAIYSSPLLRARQTAGIIQKKLNLPKVFYSSDLIEVKTSAQGELITKLNLIHHDYFSSPVWHLKDDTIEGIRMRMCRITENISKKYKGQSVVAVSHGDPILIFKAYINKLPMELSSIRHERYDINHAEILQLEIINNQKPTINSVFVPKI